MDQYLEHLFSQLDNFTKNHSIIVSRLVELVAKSYGFNALQTKLLGNAARVHDIGKINIEREILYKNGKLTDPERSIIQLHANYGADMLSPLPKIYQDVALSHHEKLDGSGYPFGLKKGEIPFAAQVVGVCDVYEALSAERPYKMAKPYKEVKQKLLKYAEDGLFDRDIVNKVQEAGKVLKKAEVLNNYYSLKYI